MRKIYEMKLTSEPKCKITSDSLLLFVKYFILLAITAVLSLESKYENMVASSQSSATARQEKEKKWMNLRGI